MSKKKPYLSEEDKALFREMTKDVKPLKSNKVSHEKIKPNIERKKPILIEPTPRIQLTDPSFYTITANQTLFFKRSGLQQKILNRLCKGQMNIEASIDLHGLTIDKARAKLTSFIHFAYENHYRVVHIIHGKGKAQPILKNCVYFWLKQLNLVLAFVSAMPKHGGTGAIYCLLRRKKLNE